LHFPPPFCAAALPLVRGLFVGSRIADSVLVQYAPNAERQDLPDEELYYVPKDDDGDEENMDFDRLPEPVSAAVSETAIAALNGTAAVKRQAPDGAVADGAAGNSAGAVVNGDDTGDNPSKRRRVGDSSADDVDAESAAGASGSAAVTVKMEAESTGDQHASAASPIENEEYSSFFRTDEPDEEGEVVDATAIARRVKQARVAAGMKRDPRVNLYTLHVCSTVRSLGPVADFAVGPIPVPADSVEVKRHPIEVVSCTGYGRYGRLHVLRQGLQAETVNTEPLNDNVLGCWTVRKPRVAGARRRLKLADEDADDGADVKESENVNADHENVEPFHDYFLYSTRHVTRVMSTEHETLQVVPDAGMGVCVCVCVCACRWH